VASLVLSAVVTQQRGAALRLGQPGAVVLVLRRDCGARKNAWSSQTAEISCPRNQSSCLCPYIFS
jgi:hypothetical protein